MDKLAYHYNKKKLPAKTEGKYLYYYPCADIENASIQMGGRGFVTIEVTEKEWEALIELDRIEYNNEHKYVRHTIAIPDCEEDNLTVKQQEQLHVKDSPIEMKIAEDFDKKDFYRNLTEDEEKILSMLENGYTQKEIAKELNVTQGYVSMLKIRAQYNYDYIERTSALQMNSPEYIWKCWDLFIRKLEMPMFLDVELEYVIGHIHPNDIAHFLYWYYSLGEFVRFTIQYYLYNEDSIEKEKAEYLSKASEPELKWFNENYADELPLVQIVYIRLIDEVENRRNRGLHGNNNAIDGLYTAVEKLAKRVNISPEEYFTERINPIIVTIRRRRIKQFYRFYSGKKLKKLNYF